jgi:MFS family permease
MSSVLKYLKDPVIRNVLKLGGMFFCMFFAFNVTQTFMSKTVGKDGVAALGALYVSFSVSSLIATWLIDKLGGPRRAMLASMATIVLFMLSNLYPKLELLVPVSIVLGVGAAVLWTAHGAYLSAHGDSSTFGLYSGIFFALFMSHLILGNLFAALFFALVPLPEDPNDHSVEQIFIIILTVVCISSAGFWWFLKDTSQLRAAKPAAAAAAAAAVPATSKAAADHDDHVEHEHIADDVPLTPQTGMLAITGDQLRSDSDHHDQDAAPTKAATVSTKDRLLSTVLVVKERPMQVLSVVLVFSGLTQAFFYVIVPARITEKEQVGWVMVVYGIAEVVVALVAGPLGDRLGRAILIVASLVLAIGGAIGSIFYPTAPIWVPFICAFLFGSSDTISNTQLYGAIPELTPNADAGFAFWKVFQTLSFALFLFMFAGEVDFVVIAGIFIGVAVLSIISIVALYSCCAKRVGDKGRSSGV